MKILVVLSRIPFPLEKGDKLRAYYQIRELSKWHDLYLVALYSGSVPAEAMRELTPYCREIHFLRQHPVRSALNMAASLFVGLPLQCGYFYSHRNHKRIDKIIQEVQPDRIYCQLFRMAEYVRHCRIPKVLDYQDAFSMGMERRAQKAFPLFRSVMRMEAHRIAHYETDIFDDFEHKTMITALDRDCIQHPMKEEIVVIPNGVDFTKFSHEEMPKTYDLIFSGNMNYAPNVDAAVYLVKEILPELRKKHPDVRLMLAGARQEGPRSAKRVRHRHRLGAFDDRLLRPLAHLHRPDEVGYRSAEQAVGGYVDGTSLRDLAPGRQTAVARRGRGCRRHLQHHPPICRYSRQTAHGRGVLPDSRAKRPRLRARTVRLGQRHKPLERIVLIVSR